MILYVISISRFSLDVVTKSSGLKSAGQKVTPGLTKNAFKMLNNNNNWSPSEF